jgi:hypothetical protein
LDPYLSILVDVLVLWFHVPALFRGDENPWAGLIWQDFAAPQVFSLVADILVVFLLLVKGLVALFSQQNPYLPGFNPYLSFCVNYVRSLFDLPLTSTGLPLEHFKTAIN